MRTNTKAGSRSRPSAFTAARSGSANVRNSDGQRPEEGPGVVGVGGHDPVHPHRRAARAPAGSGRPRRAPTRSRWCTDRGPRRPGGRRSATRSTVRPSPLSGVSMRSAGGSVATAEEGSGCGRSRRLRALPVASGRCTRSSGSATWPGHRAPIRRCSCGRRPARCRASGFDPAGLVTACRRIVDRHVASAPAVVAVRPGADRQRPAAPRRTGRPTRSPPTRPAASWPTPCPTTPPCACSAGPR